MKRYHASRVAVKWSRKRNPPMMDPWETDLLIRYARNCRVHFVEIGTYMGGATAIISRYLPRGVELTTIDIFGESPRGSSSPGRIPTYEEAKRTIEKEGNITKVRIIRGVSWEVAKNWSRDIDVLFIDGDHRYEAVKKDFENWEPHVIKGGHILFHDTDFPGVQKALKEVSGNPGFSLEEEFATFAVFRKL